MNEQIKSELLSMMKEMPPSSIQLEKPFKETDHHNININNINREIWGSKASSLLDDYKYGESLARFGESGATIKIFLKRFTEAIISTISNEYQKRGNGSEDLKPLFKILESDMVLIAKEIEKKDLKDFNIYSIIASLQGFLTNFNQRKE